MDVGLPDGQMGNSEVGHTNLGAGRVVYQELTRISQAIEDGSFYGNPVILKAMKSLPKDATLHLMGLLSDGGVHSHTKHLFALLVLAKRCGCQNIAVHCFLDGRDADPHSGMQYLQKLESFLADLGVGRIATIGGRYYGMDRDHRWKRLKMGYDAIVNAKGERFSDAARMLLRSYREGVTDEFAVPMVADDYSGMSDGDAVIFFNFRPDRAREITRAIVDPEFDHFEVRKLALGSFVTMTSYDKTMPNVQVAFLPQVLENTLEQVVAANGKKQLHIAETEKYAHVTFFFGGGVESPSPGENRILVPSPKVRTYDLKPEMSAFEITNQLIAELARTHYDLVVLNFANCDMVGHTGTSTPR
jgi:2,3-bisphosphoglycerate-independent phosphoglycerate mutase